jgi:hypothetical protein
MSSTIQPIAKTIILSPAAAVTSNVANVATGTNTFHFLNASASVYAYVGVFNTYSAAAAMDHPVNGTDGVGVPLAPNESMTVVGNFGINPNPGNVFVAAITNVGTTSVFATPITP